MRIQIKFTENEGRTLTTVPLKNCTFKKRYESLLGCQY